ncbi:MAG: glutathione S-transferase family protein [Gammaproteobacteria bacterium]|nr:glutathione S-transferase family protein [Gammaproteobacteria bacterium]MCW8909418.1 glutathione S-transferase family protein [Gammaproteobacteria bacterium]MCW9056189.1 glutathione S-transferase family protein [Gammaproteobacteria bacterium]
MELKLYHTPQSRSIRPRWLMEELGLDYELITIDLFEGEGETVEYKKIHPLGQVPALAVNNEIMLESGAMCHWLADSYEDHSLAPVIGDPARRQYEQWMTFSLASLEPWPWLVMLHSRFLPENQRVAEIIPWANKRVIPVLIALNDALLDKDYLLGKQFTTADIMVGSTLLWIPQMLGDFPDLLAYAQRLKARPAYQRAMA